MLWVISYERLESFFMSECLISSNFFAMTKFMEIFLRSSILSNDPFLCYKDQNPSNNEKIKRKRFRRKATQVWFLNFLLWIQIPKLEFVLLTWLWCYFRLNVFFAVKKEGVIVHMVQKVLSKCISNSSIPMSSTSTRFLSSMFQRIIFLTHLFVGSFVFSVQFINCVLEPKSIPKPRLSLKRPFFSQIHKICLLLPIKIFINLYCYRRGSLPWYQHILSCHYPQSVYNRPPHWNHHLLQKEHNLTPLHYHHFNKMFLPISSPHHHHRHRHCHHGHQLKIRLPFHFSHVSLILKVEFIYPVSLLLLNETFTFQFQLLICHHLHHWQHFVYVSKIQWNFGALFFNSLQ